MKTQKVIVQGVGEITLTQKDFIAQGGEGSVYGRNNVAYKIYEDVGKMVPMGKIQELSALTHPNIIKPEKVLTNGKGQAIGYTMKMVPDNITLCQLFTKAYKQRNNIDEKMTLKLVKRLQELVDHVHKKKILIVDLNELNFLVDAQFKDVFAIDVNSYQTPSYPATVLMESVRDRHAKSFSDLTDWFSWGIVTFQLLIGIHPYKGNHPDYEKMPLDERINARMLKHISVFNPKVKYPKVCAPLDVIPPALRSWYKAVFEEGKRIMPPSDYELTGQIIVHVKEIKGSNVFDINELAAFQDDIINFYSHLGNKAYIFANKVSIEGKTYDLKKQGAKVFFTQKQLRPMAAYLDNGLAKIWDLKNQTEINLNLQADNILQYEDRIYIQTNTNVLELHHLEFNNNVSFSTKLVGRVLDAPKATKVFEGAIVQGLLGRFHFSIFPESGKCYQIAIKELDDYKVVEAKYQKNVLVVLGHNRLSGKYDRFVFRLNPNYQTYDMRKVENVTPASVNFAVNDAGICVLMTEDEKIEAFSNRINSAGLKIIDDPSVESDMILYNDGRMCFAKGKKFYSISIK